MTTKYVAIKQVKKAIKAALPASNKIEDIWNIQGCFYGYQITGLSYANRCKIVDGIAVLLN